MLKTFHRYKTHYRRRAPYFVVKSFGNVAEREHAFQFPAVDRKTNFFLGGVGLHPLQEEAGAPEQDGPVDDQRSEPRNRAAPSNAASAFRQEAQAGKGTFRRRKGESTFAKVGERSAEAIFGTAGAEGAFL